VSLLTLQNKVSSGYDTVGKFVSFTIFEKYRILFYFFSSAEQIFYPTNNGKTLSLKPGQSPGRSLLKKKSKKLKNIKTNT
jgi:hypothetical protein